MHPDGSGLLDRQGERRLLEIYRMTFNQDPEALLQESAVGGLERDSLVVRLAWKRLVDSVQISNNDLRALNREETALTAP